MAPKELSWTPNVLAISESVVLARQLTCTTRICLLTRSNKRYGLRRMFITSKKVISL